MDIDKKKTAAIVDKTRLVECGFESLFCVDVAAEPLGHRTESKATTRTDTCINIYTDAHRHGSYSLGSGGFRVRAAHEA